MVDKKNIGFMGHFGFGRGMSNTILMWAKMLNPTYNIHVLKHGNNPIEEYYKTIPISITESEGYIVSPDTFKKWILDNKIEAVVFQEYKQWTDEPENLVKLAKSLGCKVYGYLVLEKFKKGQELDYDRVICTSLTMQRFMRGNQVRKHTYIPFSIDLNEFSIVKRELTDTFTFFHCGGFLGYKNRKNTSVVLEAFEKLRKENKNVKLLITSQVPLKFPNGLPEGVEVIDKNLTREKIVEMYYKADALVLPTRWESVGVNLLEALSAGLPVITTDAPPMNEFIRTGLNGYLCKPNYTFYPDITVPVAEVDANTLKKNMGLIMNQTLYPLLAKNARAIAEKLYSLENNKKYFLNFLEKELNDN